MQKLETAKAPFATQVVDHQLPNLDVKCYVFMT